MPKNQSLPVKELSLDLHNFRTVPQASESKAIHGMIVVKPEWFWALMESLIEDGYLPTENILILNVDGKMVVKEGNRRIAAMKLIHGTAKLTGIDLPPELEEALKKLPASWKTDNAEVPCTVYQAKESAIVDRIVTLTHGKGEKAGRDKWEAVARARHNRDINKESEPALDLLEKYLKSGENITAAQKERWGGVYPLSVLEEAIKKIAPRFKLNSARELADIYPKIKDKAALETVLLDIGLGKITFETMRHKNALDEYGLPNLPPPPAPPQPTPGGSPPPPSAGSGGSPPPPTPPPAPAPPGDGGKPAAVPLNSAKSVMRELRKFKPAGKNRDKVVTLRDEALNLKLDRNPLAFCFVLRSMFEISAKAYCKDHAPNGPKVLGADGRDRPLVDVLRDIVAHLKKNNTSQQFLKDLHGAITEMAKASGLLSINSMNALVHHPKFTTTESNICSTFHHIFPLLEAMNR